jgi:hypothetical protein
MPQRYSVRNNQTGKTVTFEWHLPTPPTEADLEEVFAADEQRQAPVAPPAPAAPPAPVEKPNTWVPVPDNYPWKDGTGIIGIDAMRSLFSKEQLPSTVAAGVGAGLAASGVGLPLAIPASAAAAAETRWLLGGTKEEAAKEAAIEGVTNAAAFGIPRVVGGLGRRMVRSALKKGSATPGELDKLVQTSIYEGITPSRHGYAEADQLVSDLTGEVRKIVQGLKSGRVDVQRALLAINQVKDRALRRGATDTEISALDNLATQYAQRYGDNMAPVAAHELKVGLMERAGAKGAYEQGLPPTVGEGQAAFASGLREQLEQLAEAGGRPIDALNDRASKLIALRDSMMTTEPPVHPAGMVAGAFGGPKVAAIQIGTRPAVQAAAGRRIARVAQAFDPKYMGVPSPQYPERGPGLSLDELGIPETTGAPWAPDALDAAGIPVGRGVVDEADMWLRRFAPEPQITHKRPIRGLLPPAPIQLGPPDGSFVRSVPAELAERIPKSMDQLGIPEVSGDAFERDALSALDIPATREMYSPEDLWMQKHFPPEMFQWWKSLPDAEKRRLMREGVEIPYDAARASAPPQGVSRSPERLTKSEIQALYKRYLERSK